MRELALPKTVRRLNGFWDFADCPKTDRRLNGFWDFADYPKTDRRLFGLLDFADCPKTDRRLFGLLDFADYPKTDRRLNGFWDFADYPKTTKTLSKNLFLNQLTVMSILGHQLVVGAAFRDPAVFHDQDLISGPDGAEPVGHQHHCPVFDEIFQPLQNKTFGVSIQCVGRFIQKKVIGFFVNRPGNEQPLALALAQPFATGASFGIESFGQLLYEIV